jgi:hypothetical protein
VVRDHIRSNIVGYVALFVALSGVAYAANAVPKNSVSSSSIKTGAVKSSDVGDEALTGTDVSEATLGEVPNAGSLDSLDSSAFVKDTDNAGGDLGGPFSNLDIAANAVGGGELNSTALRPQNIAPNGTPGVSGTVPIIFLFSIDNGAPVFKVAPKNMLVTHVWTIGKSPDVGTVRVEAPNDLGGITNAIDPTEDTIVPAATIDLSLWGINSGETWGVSANNTSVDAQVMVLAVPNIAP